MPPLWLGRKCKLADQWLPSVKRRTSSGIGLVRPLEAKRAKNGRADSSAAQDGGPDPRASHVRKNYRYHGDQPGQDGKYSRKKGVILATGGSTGNVNFRRMFDPRLTEEFFYCGVAGRALHGSRRERRAAGIAIGASLWGLYNQTGEFGASITKPGRIGCQYGYVNLPWQPTSPIFELVRAIGLRVADWQDVILVNQAGVRFYDETVGQFTSNNYKRHKKLHAAKLPQCGEHQIQPKKFLKCRNGRDRRSGQWRRANLGDLRFGRCEARELDGRSATRGYRRRDFFAAAETIAELASNIKNKYQKKPMPADVLEKTVTNYNSFVDAGKDGRLWQPAPKYKIQTPPFLCRLGQRQCFTTRAPASGSTLSAR